MSNLETVSVDTIEKVGRRHFVANMAKRTLATAALVGVGAFIGAKLAQSNDNDE